MRYFLLFFMFPPLFSYAQTTFQLSLDSRSGYEYNTFNQPSPLQSDTSRSNNIQSGAFQQFGFTSTLKKIIKKHQFSWVAKAKIDHFWQLSAASLQRWETGLNYKYQWTKRKFLRVNVKYLSYQTNRADNGTAVIAIPAAYQRWSSKLHYQWQPLKRNKSIFSLQWSKRAFNATQNEQLKYRGYEGTFQTTQRFKRQGKKSSYLNLAINFQQRDYTNSVFEANWELDDFENWEIGEDEEELTEEDWENEEDDPNTYRRWQYFNPSIDYSFYIHSDLRLTTGIAYEKRKDVWEERFSYQQIGSFVALRWKKQKWQANWKIGTTIRQFSDLFADLEEDHLLLHVYLRNSLSISYELADSWTIFTNINFRKRWRNQPLKSSNSYLPYFTGLASIGLRYKFNKN